MVDINDSRTVDDFYQKLSNKFPYVKSASWIKLKEISIVKRLEKGEVLLRHGERSSFGIFVVGGWLKLSYFDEKDRERIAAFCSELEYIDNWNAIHKQESLPYLVEAISASIVILYPIKKMVETFRGEYDLLQLCIDLSQEIIRKKQEHYEILALRSPEARYLYLLKSQRKLLMTISLTDLAKFLHLSREALSRARNQTSMDSDIRSEI